MTSTGHRSTNLSNSIGAISDDAYGRNPMSCRYCDIVADTVEKAHSKCEGTGRRHFLIALSDREHREEHFDDVVMDCDYCIADLAELNYAKTGLTIDAEKAVAARKAVAR